MSPAHTAADPDSLPALDAGSHAARLLAWYDRHRRDLPWRAAAGARQDPYLVWLSEIMLQQTTVPTVRGYFARFVQRWPTVQALAGAPLDDVLAAWAGLGYYARARNLHRCAQVVARELGGCFPVSEAALAELPGVGPYTAAAIAAIAFDVPASAVDGNVERVVTRLAANRTPLPASKPQIRAIAAALVPPLRAGDYAQAMMDLGAGLCTPRAPACTICPLRDGCTAARLGIAASLPARAEKPERPIRRGLAFVLRRADGAILLRRRPPRGLLGGMLEVPSSTWTEGPLDREAAEAAAPVAAPWRRLPGRVEHTFTHFHLELEVAAARLSIPVAGSIAGADWHAVSTLEDLALPSVMRKVIEHALTGPVPPAKP